ncbi:alpha/beta fold hydrolase [Motilibacter deserti]|uniref:alpha/beta fold hydrolase n=1 Tax=Motilibacter deserti TaxID=2714956 RepID=UPI0038B3EE6B
MPAPRPAPRDPAAVLARHAVTEAGSPDGPVLLLSHGFGTGQDAWRRLVPHFPDHRVVLFDHLGSGRSDLSAFDHERHGRLGGYAEDVLDICAALDLRDVTLVGHSVSAMVAVLAAAADPGRFAGLVLLAPSPRYVDDPETGYTGGFSLEDIHELLESLDSNYYAWSAAMAPVVMGNPDAPELAAELERGFVGTHPDAARTFARTLFLTDTRAVLPRVDVPALVLQCRHDALAPLEVGDAVAASLPQGDLVRLEATGHCPHVSAPDETAAAIRAHLARRAAARPTGAA